MEDIIDIIVTETTNTIEITAQPNDEIIDVNIIDNREDVTLNITPTVVEININQLTGSFGVEWGEILGTLSNQTDLNTALSLKADLVGGKVPASQLPSYVDDVVEVANYAALPATGETGKIYVTIDTNYIYRWTGSVYVEIKDSSAVWGAITGTLSSQTDLQNALNAKFDDPTGDTTQYIAGDGSLIAFPIAGQAGTLVREVRNTTGATLTKGTIVYISGATGNKPTVSKAIATGDATSAQTFGMCQANIANNSNGYVVCVGDLTELDTSAFTEGNQLYLSSTTAGTYTTTKQLAPNHLVYIGIVTRAHPTLGQIEVNIQNGYELYELHDVSITSEANNQGLFYEASTDLWKNKSIATVLGYTPEPAITAGTTAQYYRGDKTFQTLNTTAVAEGTNLYYTEGRVSANTDVAANTAARHNAVTLGTANGLSLSTQILSLGLSSSSANGALSSTDWTTFNAKQAALSGSGIVKSTGGTISYLTDNTANWDVAYNDKINSASVTGTTTKTLTLTQQDGGTVTASWTDINTDAVSSVFGRTGAVVATSGDYTTTQVTEGTNLYYTDARARGAVSAGTGISYNSTTGVITNTITQYTDALARLAISGGTGISYNSTTGVITNTITQYTDALARAALSFTAGSGGYNSTTGVITIPTNTNQLTNGASFITLTSLSGTSPISYNNTTGAISISQASGSANGFLSSTDWTTFNNKQNSLTNPVTGTGTTNYLPKFTGTSTIGNSAVSDDGTTVTLNSRALSGNAATFSGIVSATSGDIRSLGTATDGVTAGPFISVRDTSNAYQMLMQLNASYGLDIWSFTGSWNKRLTLTASGNLGLGVTPSAWGSGRTALQLQGSSTAVYFAGEGNTILSNNYYFNAGDKYIANGFSTQYLQGASGQHAWFIAPNNTSGAGAAISYTQAMTLGANGNLLIGTTADAGYKLDVNGTGRFSSNVRLETGASDSLIIFKNNASSNVRSLSYNVADASFSFNSTGGSQVAIISNSGAATFSSSVAVGTNLTVGTTSLFNSDMFTYQNGGIFFAGNGNYNSGIYGRNNGNDLAFNASSAERMRLTSTGLGIGTTAPNQKFNVVTNALGGRQNMAAIDRTAQNFVTFTNPEYSVDASMGLMLRVFPQSDARQGAGMIASGGGSNGETNLDLFVSTGSTSSVSYSALSIKGGSGNVGIGTTAPAVKFEVSGSGSIGYFRNPSSTTATTFITVLNANNTSNGLVMAHISDGTGYFGTQNSADLRLVTADTERMRITSGGNVGIGTTNPNVSFDVQGSGIRIIDATSPNFYLNNTVVQWKSFLSGNDFRINDGSSDLFTIKYNTGAIGIGTTAPSFATGSGLALKVGASDARIALKNNASGDASTDGFQLVLTTALEAVIENRENASMRFLTNATEAMRITAAGNVLIGKTSGTSKFAVVGLPTSASGLASGDFYQVSGVVMVVP